MSDRWLTYLWIGVGSALGGMGRFWVSGLVATRWGERFPWGTLAVNLSGSAAIGFLGALSLPEGRILMPPGWRSFLMIGVLGGFTTFSAFSLQTLNLAREGEWFRAALNVVLSTVLCLLGVWLGHSAGQMINR